MSNLIERLDELNAKAIKSPWRAVHHYCDKDPCSTCDTPGAWEQKDFNMISFSPGKGHSSGEDIVLGHGMQGGAEDADFKLIVELRNAYPKLRAVVLAAQNLAKSEHSKNLSEVIFGRRQFAKLVEALEALEDV
jgi:hypothetical protein